MSESHESSKEAFQRKCSILISLIASMLLINNLGSQNSGSSAAFLNASAINTYAFFQAKSIRQNDLNLTANTLDAIVDTSPTVNESTKQVIRDKAEAMRAKAKSYDSDPESGEGKKELLAKAEQADSTPLQDGLTIPAEVQRREERQAVLRRAKVEMEARAYARFQAESAQYEAKMADRQAAVDSGKKPRGRGPKAPSAAPEAKDQVNFTDEESRIMKTKDGFQQCYNAQAGVDTGSRLIVGQRVSQSPNDKQELAEDLKAVKENVNPAIVLVDYQAARDDHD